MSNIDDQISMKRYRVESVAFAPDLGSIMVRFEEIDSAGGAILSEHKEQEISLRTDPEMRQQVWEIVDLVCDVIDRAFADRRNAAR